MSVLEGLSIYAAGTLLKASVGAEIFDEEWHPLSTRDANSTDNVAVGASMRRRDTIDLRHEGLNVKFARVGRVAPETATQEYFCPRPPARFLLDLHVERAARVGPCIFRIVEVARASLVTLIHANTPPASDLRIAKLSWDIKQSTSRRIIRRRKSVR